MEETVADAERNVPDDRYPAYRAAQRLIAGGQNFELAASYLRDYLGQEPEEDRPTPAEARQLLNRIRTNRPHPTAERFR